MEPNSIDQWRNWHSHVEGLLLNGANDLIREIELLRAENAQLRAALASEGQSDPSQGETG